MSELNFKGKGFVYNHHLTAAFRPLMVDADKGIGETALDGNLIIQGDNLHRLKALFLADGRDHQWTPQAGLIFR